MGLEPLPSKERFRRGGLEGLAEALLFCAALFAAVNISAKSQTIALSSIGHTGLASVISTCETLTPTLIMGLPKQAKGRLAVEKVRRLRAMGSLCRQQAACGTPVVVLADAAVEQQVVPHAKAHAPSTA